MCIYIYISICIYIYGRTIMSDGMRVFLHTIRKNNSFLLYMFQNDCSHQAKHFQPSEIILVINFIVDLLVSSLLVSWLFFSSMEFFESTTNVLKLCRNIGVKTIFWSLEFYMQILAWLRRWIDDLSDKRVLVSNPQLVSCILTLCISASLVWCPVFGFRKPAAWWTAPANVRPAVFKAGLDVRLQL